MAYSGNVALVITTLLFLYKTAASKQNDGFPWVESERNGTWRRLSGRCNWFVGKWVFDASYSPYSHSECPFIDPGFDCQKTGRPDSEYLKYKWQPSSCNLPRFDGIQFLNKWRGKKIMFVGDSLSTNQWLSLLCLLHSSAPNSPINVVRTQLLSSATFEEFGVKILLYRSLFLVDLVREDVGVVLKLDSINNGKAWLGMDMLIFDTWHWWTHPAPTWNFIKVNNKMYKDMDRLAAFTLGLTTWARWVDSNVDSSKTKVFFVGISPNHNDGRDWGEASQTCAGKVRPFAGVRYPAGPQMGSSVVRNVLKIMKRPAYLLDISTLSQYRIDAHPSYYSGGHRGNDCSHWCVPGLPDTWNNLLYAALYG